MIGSTQYNSIRGQRYPIRSQPHCHRLLDRKPRRSLRGVEISFARALKFSERGIAMLSRSHSTDKWRSRKNSPVVFGEPLRFKLVPPRIGYARKARFCIKRDRKRERNERNERKEDMGTETEESSRTIFFNSSRRKLKVFVY